MVSAYNNFSALESLYSFRDSIQPFSLGNACRVLLSGLFLLRDKPVGFERWDDAYAALLMEDDVYFVECEGRGVGNELFVRILADDRGFAMRECLPANVVALVKTYLVDESLLQPRLANGVDQRQPPSMDVESPLVSILQDERQSIGARSLRRYVGGSAHTWAGLVSFPAFSGSWALTRQRPVVGGTEVSAFSWVFVIQEVFTRVTRASTGAGFWKWFVHHRCRCQ